VEEEITNLERQEIQQRIGVLEKKQYRVSFAVVVFFSTPMVNLFPDSIFLAASILVAVIMFYHLNQLKHEIFEISHTLR
jgi:beta-lactamase class A